MKQRMQFDGIILGNGIEARCSVSAIEVNRPGLPAAYSQYRVEQVSGAIPDGDYDVHANGNVNRIRRQNGHWIAHPGG